MAAGAQREGSLEMRAEAQQKGAEEEAEGEDNTEHTECFGGSFEKEVERNGKVG